jgi:uncharacterized protein (DUF433 family)
MGVIEANPKILGGTPCFAGTRVPVESLFDHLRAGYTIDAFLEQFPTVKREQVLAVLDLARDRIPFEAPRAAG